MLNVIYVEDDVSSRKVMTMAARMYSDQLAVTIFEDSTDFKAKLDANSKDVDIILLDIHVQPHSGFDMLKMIRADHTYAQTPVVACTASVMNDEVELLREAGFQGAISKPLDLDNIPQLLKRVIDDESVWHIW